MLTGSSSTCKSALYSSGGRVFNFRLSLSLSPSLTRGIRSGGGGSLPENGQGARLISAVPECTDKRDPETSSRTYKYLYAHLSLLRVGGPVSERESCFLVCIHIYTGLICLLSHASSSPFFSLFFLPSLEPIRYTRVCLYVRFNKSGFCVLYVLTAKNFVNSGLSVESIFFER